MNSLGAQGCLGLGLIGPSTKSFMFITYYPFTLPDFLKVIFALGQICICFSDNDEFEAEPFSAVGNL